MAVKFRLVNLHFQCDLSAQCDFCGFLIDLSHTESHEQKRGSSNDNCKKVDVIDLTLDSSSEDEVDDDEPPLKRACPSLSPVSPPPNKG